MAVTHGHIQPRRAQLITAKNALVPHKRNSGARASQDVPHLNGIASLSSVEFASA
jgi:hypothetical protein